MEPEPVEVLFKNILNGSSCGIMPRFVDEAREADREVARIAGRADPYSGAFRPRRSNIRPLSGQRQYAGTPVPGYVPTRHCATQGVVRTTIRETGDGHSFFVCNFAGVDYLFNTNDSSGWDLEVPADGSHVAKYKQHQRPMMQRESQIGLSFDKRKGECWEFSVNLSAFWHHPSHRHLSAADKQRLFTHMVSCCVGADNTREWHKRLWDYR